MRPPKKNRRKNYADERRNAFADSTAIAIGILIAKQLCVHMLSHYIESKAFSRPKMFAFYK